VESVCSHSHPASRDHTANILWKPHLEIELFDPARTGCVLGKPILKSTSRFTNGGLSYLCTFHCVVP